MSEPRHQRTDPVSCSTCCRSRVGMVVVALIAIGVGGTAVWQQVGGLIEPETETAAMASLQSRGEGGSAGFDLSNLQLPRERILSGGPAKDGIPSLVDPPVAPAAEADFMRADDRVAGVTIKGEARAYPIRVLNWHEVINDKVGEVPIAVVYCPLCDSVSVVDRRLDGTTYEFGISGLLFNSNVLMYDRKHDALWSQVGLEAVSGPNAGRSLKHLPFELTTFEQWRGNHPKGEVVTLETGHHRDYRRNPYADYFASERLMFPAEPVDRRLEPKARVVGIRLGDAARAYPIRAIHNAPEGRIRDTFGEQQLVLESASSGKGIRIAGLPAGAELVHTFWFAWAAFHPDTEIVPDQGPKTRPADRDHRRAPAPPMSWEGS